MPSISNLYEKDLDVLQREYRNMELNRRAFAEESASVLRRQQLTLEKLRQENLILNSNILRVQARTTLKPMSLFEQTQVDKLCAEKVRYSQAIDAERERLSAIDKKVFFLQSEVLKNRKKIGGVHASTNNQRLVEKQVRVLENRLDQANMKFNKSLAQNRSLRQEIDDLRVEKSSFYETYRKLEKNLSEVRKRMAEVIDQSSAAYEHRDRAQHETTVMEQSDKKEQEQFEQQMRELSEILENELKINSDKRSQQSPCDPSFCDDAKTAERKNIKELEIKKELEASFSEQRRKRIRHFDEAFGKIAAATGIPDFNELISRFLANEDQTFSLYKHASEQTSEVDKLEEQVTKLQEELSNREREKDEYAIQNDTLLREATEKARIADAQAAKLEHQSEERQKELDELKEGIKILLFKLKCEKDAENEVPVNEGNMFNYLGVIEHRANEILAKHFTTSSHDQTIQSVMHSTTLSQNGELSLHFQSFNVSAVQTSILGVGPEVPMGANDPVHINPPRLADYSSDDSSEDKDGERILRPVTLEELKAKADNIVRFPKRRQTTLRWGNSGVQVRKGRDTFAGINDISNRPRASISSERSEHAASKGIGKKRTHFIKESINIAGNDDAL